MTQSSAMKEVWSRPEYREHHEKRLRKQSQSTEMRTASSKRMKKLHKDPEFKAKAKAGHLKFHGLGDMSDDDMVFYRQLLSKGYTPTEARGLIRKERG